MTMITPRVPLLFRNASLAGAILLSLGLGACGDDDPDGVVKVFQYDGSVQCELGSGISLEQMAQQLRNAGIDVICAQKGGDGMVQAGVCGNSTGVINIYTIHDASRADARKLGFEPVSTLPEYRDAPCPTVP